ncbi:DUF6789 family protein [Catellatospora vulcania]|uniref:DUF6789 family protein n=1 Tax=Catellatospora vulcania TaxID=1460450 RepID=UPI0012D3780A|nr:DUF6789 family protein [Catellatospora vulcania]
MADGGRKIRPEWTVAAVFLASGAALLVYILSGVSLRWTFLALGLAAAAVATVVIRRLPDERRAKVLRRMAVGAVAGFAATLAYDAARIALVEFAGLQLRPFEAWRLFGLALAETDQDATWVFWLGVAFHLCNGTAFGVAYTVAFGRRGIWAAIVWALVLETFMVSVYPGWLGLKALDEFLSVSITGHLVYGVVLGWLSNRLLGSSRWGEDDRDTGADEPARSTDQAR